MSATTFVRMPTNKQLLAMGMPDLPEEAFGGTGPRLTPIARAIGGKQPALYGGGGGGLKAVVGVVAAIAIPFAAPAIASSIGLSGAIAGAVGSVTAGSVIGSAIVGAGLGAISAKVQGQDVGRGALMGGIGGGVSGYFNAPQAIQAPSGAGATVAGGQPSVNAVVTNVGSGTGYFNPELGQFVDPMTGSTIASQNIAYGGTVSGDLAAQLSSGAVDASSLANSMQGIQVNTPAVYGGNAAAFGSGGGAGAFYNPDAMALSGAAPAGGYATQAAPTYAQAGLTVTPGAEQAAAARASFDPTINAAGQPGAVSQQPGQPGQPGAAGGTGTAAPTTVSAALKQQLTDPRKQAEFLLRAATLSVGGAMAGDGMSPEERALLETQKAELEQLRTADKAAYDRKLQEAYNIVGESNYFDPAQFGLMSQRGVQTSGARAKADALRKVSGGRRSGLRTSEERRFDLGIAKGGETAYLQGADWAQQQKLRTKQAGLALVPNAPSTSLQYGQYVGNLYDAADRRRRQTAGDIGDLFGSFTGSNMARNPGITINYG
jgi:hypothetical protein